MSDQRLNYRGMETDVSKMSTPSARMKMRKFGYKSALTVGDNFVAKKFGPLMPLMVAECLAKSSNAKESCSVKLSDRYHWSWLVSARKLFVWPLSENNGVPDENATIVGKELTLPPSDLAYTADLALVFKTPNNQFVSCIAVSPEGVIRYWHTLRQHSNWIDINSQLGGEEVCCVVDLPPLGVLAITTSASMILIEPQDSDGQKTLSVNVITDRQSWLGGFGKKVSSFLGYLPAPQFMESKAIKVMTERLDDESWEVIALAGDTLQLWSLSHGKYQMLSESNLKLAINNIFSNEMDVESLPWEILDMKRYDEESFMVLASCHTLKSIVIMKFLMSDLNEAQPEPTEILTLSQQDYRCLQSSCSQSLSSIRFLPTNNFCFVYSNQIILAITLKQTTEGIGGTSESIQFHKGHFLGGCLYSGTPVFFSTTHSFVSVTPVSPLERIDSSAVESSLVMEEERDAGLSRNEMGRGDADSNSYNDAIKDAFLQHTKQNISQAKAIIGNAFSGVDAINDSPLVKAILSVSSDLINQLSSRDPRNNKKNGNFSEVSSLHLKVQMDQKEQAHAFYVHFIKDIIPPEKLTKATYEGRVRKILDILADHHERIIAARTLYLLKPRYENIIYQAVCRVAEKFSFPIDMAMNNDEYFFTQVMYVYEGLKELCLLPGAILKQGTSHDVYLKSISDVNNILIEVITQVIRTSEKKQFLNDERNHIELLASSSSGLYEYLKNMASTTAEIGIKYESTLENSHEYMSQLFSLADIILFTQKHYASPEDFSIIRSQLIDYFVDTRLYEQALALAEKFTHYPTLVKICFLTNDVGRLNSYLEKYGDFGFCEELFKFYSNSRMYSHLMNLPLTPEYEERLSKFLNDYPDISWIFAAKKSDYNKCYDVLNKLGSVENDYALRKTRILSMAKLAKLAGEIKAEDSIESDLHLLSVQDELPKSLLIKIDSSTKPIRTFSPSELIQLLVCKENTEGDEQHYKKALDLLSFVSDLEARDQLWEKIWERALMKDRYSYQELGPPEHTVDNMLLFKLIKLIIVTEDRPEDFIPSYKRLTNIPSLKEDISEDSQLKFIIRYGYEAFCESSGIHKSD